MNEIPYFNLSELQKKLETIHFWGDTNLKWQDGELILIETKQTFKPKDFDRVAE
mgnify:CR=1 FL=1